MLPVTATGRADAVRRRAPALSVDALMALAVAIVSRLAVFAVGYAVAGSARAPGLSAHASVVQRLTREWAFKDGGWFIAIAQGGYRRPDSPSFFPAYPLALRAATLLTGGDYLVAGVLLSLACFAAAMVLLYRLTAAELGTRAAALAVAFISVFPTAVSFGLVYSESLFLLLCLAAFAFARRGSWALAGLAGMLAVATRSSGLVLLPALLVLYGQQRGWSLHSVALRRRDLRLAWLLLVPAGLVAFMAYLWWRRGDPLAFGAAEHAYWGRALAWPWRDPWRGFHAALGALRLLYVHSAGLGRLLAPVNGVPDPLLTLLGFAVLVLVVVLIAAGWRRLPPAYTVFTVGSVLVPLLFPSDQRALYSFPRLVGVVFPLFMVLGLLTRRRPVLAWTLIACSFVGLLWVTRLFALDLSAV